MKKYLVALAPIAATAVMAITPSSALAVSGWGGWTDAHQDNAASADYWLNHFGNDGSGDSQYCVDPNGTYNSCPDNVVIPLYFTGAQANNGLGCSHDTGTNSDGTDPCTPGNATLGGVYGGTSYGGTQLVVGGVGTPVYTGGSGSGSLPGVGVSAEG